MRRISVLAALAGYAGVARAQSRSDPALAAVQSAWAQADFLRAQTAAEVYDGPARDEALALLVRAAAARGAFARAIEAFGRIRPGYRGDRDLIEAVLLAHLWQGEAGVARSFAEEHRLTRDAALRERLRIAAETPISVNAAGIVDLPFSADRLSEILPGVAATVNGTPLVARLDTGGSFIHMTRGKAAQLGVTAAGCERSFAALSVGSVCHGRAALTLGGARLENVPVAVHDDGQLQTDGLAQQFGVEFGVIIGTNVFRQFLTTVDAPARHLVLSPRGDAGARAQHLARYPIKLGETPFGVLGDHFILVTGQIGETGHAVLFVDTGLAAGNDAQGQAAALASRARLRRLGVPMAPAGRFAELPLPLRLAGAEANGLTAFEVTDRMWRDGFAANWRGIDVDLLISHGFLKRWPWSLDFDGQRLVVHGASA